MTEQQELRVSSGLVLIEPKAQQPLTDAQQRFNALSQQLASQQQELQLWQHTMQQLQQKVLAELLPLYRQRAAYHWQMAERLDDGLSSYKLGKREQARLQDIICALCDTVLQYSDDPQQQQQASHLYAHYQPAPDIAVEALADESSGESIQTALVTETAMRQYLLVVCGIDCEGMLAGDVQKLYAQMQQLEQQQNEAEQMQQQRRQQRQQTRQKKQQATGQQQAHKETEALASKSFKLVYQRLASMLHPDREQDEQQKLLKTVLMQKATDAYQAKDLMTLLALQQQAQQLAVATPGNNRSTQALHGLLDKQLEVYILNLQKQSTQLAEDILACKAEAADMVNYPHYYRAKPKDILDRVKQAISYQQQVVQAIQHDLKQLTDVDSIKQLIQHYRV